MSKFKELIEETLPKEINESDKTKDILDRDVLNGLDKAIKGAKDKRLKTELGNLYSQVEEMIYEIAHGEYN